MTGQRVLVLGTGPMTMGQAPEFNNATVAACRALRDAGHTVVLVDSHAASLAGCADVCSRSYLEPLNRDTLEKILSKERPHSVLATVGGRNALNLALLLHQFPHGVARGFTFFGVTGEILASTQNAESLARIVGSLGARAPRSFEVATRKKGVDLGRQLGFPVVVRAALAPGGVGTSITYNIQELERAVEVALAVSPVGQAVVEKSLAGCKRTEWVAVRDARDQTAIIGSVEYIEPLGIHSCDSPAVLPAQSFSDMEQTAARKLTNQLAHGPSADDMTVVSVAPRVTRASLWCGRVAGIPLAAWHTRLCAGTSLEELSAAASGATANLFEQEEPPRSCWCRLPLFPGSRLMRPLEVLTTSTKSVGSVVGVGADFIVALQKAISAAGRPALGPGSAVSQDTEPWGVDELVAALAKPTAQRLWLSYRALQAGVAIDELHHVTGIDQWFLSKLDELHDLEVRWAALQPKDLLSKASAHDKILREAKRMGCTDKQLSRALGFEEARFRACRSERKITPGVAARAQEENGEETHSVFQTVSYDTRGRRFVKPDGDAVLLLASNVSLVERGHDYRQVGIVLHIGAVASLS